MQENIGDLLEVAEVSETTSAYTLTVPKAKEPLQIPVKIRGIKEPVTGLVDSGAQSYFVSKRLANQLSLLEQAQYVEPIIVQVAVEDQKRTTNMAVQIPVSITLDNNITISKTIAFYIVDGIKDQLYLGLPFVKQFAQIIPWNLVQIEETVQRNNVAKNTVHLDSVTTKVKVVDRAQFVRDCSKGKATCLGLMQIKLDVDEIKTPNRNDAENEVIKRIHRTFADVITDEEPHGLPPKRFISHRITLLEGTQPTHRTQYRLSRDERVELQKQVEELLKQGFIKESSSPYNAPVLFVKKKTGELRMCVDYRLLNLHTIKDRFPIPLIDDILSSFGKSTYFSKLDLRSGYHQVRIAPEDTEKTAFSSLHNHYEWLVMPFGLTNAPSTFQRMMNKVLGQFVGKFVQVYLDDIIIYSPDQTTHEQHVREVLQTLRENNLICKKKKCEFFQKEIKFLGFLISHKGILPDPVKIEAVQNWPNLKTPKDAQRFLGLTNFYRRFIVNYSKKAAPLTDFANEKQTWGTEQNTAFMQLKAELTQSPVLIIPRFQDGYTFVVTSDACGTALGFTLEQLDPEGKLMGVIAYGSVKLHGAELNYPVREKEFMAIIKALKTWRNLLMYQKFIIQTDHHSLVYLQHQNHLNQSRLARWLDFLSQFDFTIKYIAGKTNSAADALSRRDDQTTADPDSEKQGEYTSRVQTEELELAAIIEAESQAYVQSLNTDLRKDIIQGYSRDPGFQTVYDCLKNNKPVPKEMRNHAKHFKIDNEFLLFSAVGEDYRICIPNYAELRTRLISNVHDSPTGAHFGSLRTYDVLQRQFYWQKMWLTVKKFTASCYICQTSKPTTQLTQGLLKPLEIPVGRFKEVTMDFLSGIPMSNQGHNMIFVIVDRFSKRARFIPCTKELTGEGAAQLFLSHYFVHYGIPRKIISDKDVRFMGSFWKTVWHALGSSLLFTTTAHPQTDGQSERMMRIINQAIRAVCRNNLQNWDLLLPAVEFAYNSTIQASTQKAPFEIDLGTIPDAPTFSSTWNLDPAHDRAEDYCKALEAITKQTQDQLVQAQRSQEAHHNKGKRPSQFHKGDFVLIHKNVWGPNDAYGKWSPYYLGPYKIVKMLNENVAEVALGMTKKQRTINVEWMKPYVERDVRYHKKVPRTPLETVSRINEINDIIGLNTDKKTFTVTWSGCDPTHATVVTFEQFDKIKNPQYRTSLLREVSQFSEIFPSSIGEPALSKAEYMHSLKQQSGDNSPRTTQSGD